ncbi:MAG: SulP family inorganic anion transporter [Brevundimonas sp.]|uniref:SulP family inorganic anion transporter n=1 Tax=Brevundimonas sp. TaxID=1871086 RepID=UPI00261690A8|nr:SulP family inorganic anion transporter [Brevundimonas sp.]MDI6624068.1 SulP family inorganic anion transporter [Brevundimonas sp.]MDQ7811544.1 SulP family inorganic anion transporter [Brevundimonas sp.]
MGADWKLFLPKTVTVLRQGYGFVDFRADGIAGLTVAVVALPLAMALAIASGATPEAGLVTAVVAGFLISALGGSRFQIGGPTGAFVVIVYGVISKHGYDGLLMATLMAGSILVVAGLARVGSLIKYIPDPVTTGFTSGIAVVILASQLPDLLGLTAAEVPAEFIPKMQALWAARDTLTPPAVALSAVCVAAILVMRRHAPKAPGFLIATVAAAVAVAAIGLPVETIGSRFGEMNARIPLPDLSFWTWGKAVDVLPSALAIALLAGVESLLSAVVADQMTGRRHRSNMELTAQGVANIASAAVGGLPATGAIARTATNIRAGARTPVAGMLHAAFLLVFMLVLAPVMVFVPMAALAAILVVVAMNMAESHRFRLILRTSSGDRAVLLATFGLTVLVDLTVAIGVGMTLATFIFMHRMSALATLEGRAPLIEGDRPDIGEGRYAPNQGLPEDVGVLTFRGPLFFGSAGLIKDAMDRIGTRRRTWILRLEDVPMLDPTGALAFADLLARMQGDDAEVIVVGASHAVLKSLMQATPRDRLKRVRFVKTFATARKRVEAAHPAPA